MKVTESDSCEIVEFEKVGESIDGFGRARKREVWQVLFVSGY